MHARWSWGRAILFLLGGALGLWLLCLGAVVLWAKRDGARKADAIVVLGAAQYAGRPSPVLRARLDHGIALWRRGLAPRIVFTGGKAEGDAFSEADAGRRYAIRQGVPDSVIQREGAGRTTSGSLRAVARMLRDSAQAPGRRPRVILVSDPFHMLRIAVTAHRVGLNPYTSPTRTSPIDQNEEVFWRYVLRESVKAPMAYILEREPE